MNQTDDESYMLDPEMFDTICEYFKVKPFCDLFADEYNRQCIYYVCKEMDTLSCTFDNQFWYWANPPWSLLDRFVEQLKKQKLKCILLHPQLSPKASKILEECGHSAGDTVLIEVYDGIFTGKYNKDPLPAPKWLLYASKLNFSGKLFK